VYEGVFLAIVTPFRFIKSTPHNTLEYRTTRSFKEQIDHFCHECTFMSASMDGGPMYMCFVSRSFEDTNDIEWADEDPGILTAPTKQSAMTSYVRSPYFTSKLCAYGAGVWPCVGGSKLFKDIITEN
jgi:hypothetical protein